MNILITGGAGYIGNTIAYALADAGHQAILLDEQPAPASAQPFSYYQGDIADKVLLNRIVASHPAISLVIHCAAKIDVAESTLKPGLYYANNFSKAIEMVNHLLDLGINKLILSGTASLYNAEGAYCFDEQWPTNPTSPYARSKSFLELALKDLSSARDLQLLIFRYFNPIGSDHQLRSGFSGANKSSLLNSLISAVDNHQGITINGNDWPTRDGSTIRDFVDVRDLADAHVLASEALGDKRLLVPLNDFALPVINLGSQQGVTVKEFVAAFAQATHKQLHIELGVRRPGDIIGGYASSQLAQNVLGWRASTTLQNSIINSLKWAARH